jgi:isopentenyl diphosphate isomerase/L-lactate dehydrogenase-like FMN-dependent dehydrogenase
MVHKDGELASAVAAAELNQLFVLSSESTFSIEEVVTATKGKGPMMFEIDVRLPDAIINDLIKRVAAHDCFIGIVINAQFISNRITENEWKNDFIIPPFLKAGSLKKYKAQYGTTDSLRDCYGLLSPSARKGSPFKFSDLNKIRSLAK